jgi:hypothetical protein
MRTFHRHTLASGFVLLACGLAAAAEPVKPEQFNKLQQLIKPDAEKWEQIPWQTSLWQARQQAAAQGKPILLWEMDGNPLGCT